MLQNSFDNKGVPSNLKNTFKVYTLKIILLQGEKVSLFEFCGIFCHFHNITALWIHD